MIELFEKSKDKYPIGTIHGGYKKVAEGKWVPVRKNGERRGGDKPKFKPDSWTPHYADSKNLKRYKEIYRVANTLDLPFDYDYDPREDKVYALNLEAKEKFKKILDYWKKKGKTELLNGYEKGVKMSKAKYLQEINHKLTPTSAFELDEEVTILIKASKHWEVWDMYSNEQKRNVIDAATNIIKSRVEKGGPGSGRKPTGVHKEDYS